MNRAIEIDPEEPARRVGVIVLGMHRSGTSPLTRLLNLVGCDLPATLMGANSSNQTGHWESTAICRLNDRILESAGSSWQDWGEFNRGWYRSPKAEEFRQDAVALLRQEYGGSHLFVLKDPRICRLAPFWLSVFKRDGIRPLVVSPVRNPLEVAASLQKRNGFDPSFGHLLWLRHVLEAELATRGVPRLFSTYDGLFNGWAQLLEKAPERLDIAWPKKPAQASAEIEAFLDTSHRHHHENSEALLANPLHSRWLQTTFRILEDWARTGERAADFVELDTIRNDFNRAAPSFAALVESGHQATQELRSLTKQFAALQQQSEISLEDTARIRDRLGRTERKLSERDDQLQKASAELSGAEERANRAAEEVRSLLHERDRQLAALRAELNAKYQQTTETDKAVADLRSRLAQTESALAQRRLEAEQTAAELEKTRRELNDSLRQLQGQRDEFTALKAASGEQLDAVRGQLNDSLGQLQTQRDEFAALKAASGEQLDAVRRQLNDALGQLQAQRDQFAGLKAASGEQLEAVRGQLNDSLDQLQAQRDEFAGLQSASTEQLDDIRRQLNEALGELHGQRDAYELLKKHSDAGLETARRELDSVIGQLTGQRQELSELRAASAKLRTELGGANAENQRLTANVGERFDEIAILTRRVRDNETSAAAYRDEVISLFAALTKLLDRSRWSFLPRRLQLRRQAALVRQTGLFDAQWYLSEYRDVAEAGVDPLLHYLEFGLEEGRSPNPKLSKVAAYVRRD